MYKEIIYYYSCEKCKYYINNMTYKPKIVSYESGEFSNLMKCPNCKTKNFIYSKIKLKEN